VGNCTSGIGSFVCTCSEGWVGVVCQDQAPFNEDTSLSAAQIGAIVGYAVAVIFGLAIIFFGLYNCLRTGVTGTGTTPEGGEIMPTQRDGRAKTGSRGNKRAADVPMTSFVPDSPMGTP